MQAPGLHAMKKNEIIFRAITRAGLDPLEFNIYPSSNGQPVIIEQSQKVAQVAKTSLITETIDSSSALIIYTDDGIKKIAAQIKEKFL